MTKVTVQLDGNFFKRDPGKTLRGNIKDMLDVLAGEMEQAVDQQIQSHESQMPAYTGWTVGHVLGRTHSVGGKRWGTWAVVSANTQGLDRKDAIRTKAAAAGIERRWHPFRLVKSAVYRSRALISADLTEGLN